MHERKVAPHFKSRGFRPKKAPQPPVKFSRRPRSLSSKIAARATRALGSAVETPKTAMAKIEALENGLLQWLQSGSRPQFALSRARHPLPTPSLTHFHQLLSPVNDPQPIALFFSLCGAKCPQPPSSQPPSSQLQGILVRAMSCCL